MQVWSLDALKRRYRIEPQDTQAGVTIYAVKVNGAVCYQGSKPACKRYVNSMQVY